MDRASEHRLESILELLANLLGDEGHTKVIADVEP